MDSLLARFPATIDADLMLCAAHGCAYQRDMGANRVLYDEGYLGRVDAYEGSAIARAVNLGRCELLSRHLRPGASVLDIGAGSGAFVRAANASGFACKGFEVIPNATLRLRAAHLYAEDDPTGYDAVTLWDTIEHLEDPGPLLRSIDAGSMLFLSLPIFDDLRAIRESKHYRPGEHLTYWTADGLVAWMTLYGFRLLESSDHETDAGRESIGAFAFMRRMNQS